MPYIIKPFNLISDNNEYNLSFESVTFDLKLYKPSQYKSFFSV